MIGYPLGMRKGPEVPEIGDTLLIDAVAAEATGYERRDRMILSEADGRGRAVRPCGKVVPQPGQGGRHRAG